MATDFKMLIVFEIHISKKTDIYPFDPPKIDDAMAEMYRNFEDMFIRPQKISQLVQNYFAILPFILLY